MFRDGMLKGKNVLITGGGTGIGNNMARRFGSLGAKIAILGRREEILKEATADLGSNGIKIIYHKCDIRSPEQIKESMDYFESEFGHIDVLVNNAAGNFAYPTEKLSAHAVDSVLNIVLHGTIYMTIEAGRRWIQSGHKGVVLDIVTPYAWTGSAYVVPSAAAKAGVLAVVRSLAVEWAKYGIRHVAIAPGIFPTPATQKNLFPLAGMEEVLKNRVPLGRTGRLDEISNLASFLISDEASFINGEVVTIDGGEWLKGAGEFSDLSVLTDEQWEQIKKISTGK
ncbi:MAG: SDR family oxidoreductase [Thermoplasmatales archaeon]|nr:SDR family oxidoreductase [Candidatus Thermoplasmatota archaeon]MCL6002798.1 SDR family oxidoreductase [Candidatus Thermoplasmatota archaeon]MDA8056127.1 SDR family oxidoreductase [Thermoplasmatales archaeon]